MQLIGSPASPYVRRIRLFLNKRDYTFTHIDIFSPDGRKFLTDNNPAQKIPVFIDGENTLYDSRVIFRYLAQKFQSASLTWPQENLLTLIDAANDSFISLLLLKRSDIDSSQDKLFFNLQHEKIDTVLSVLNKEVENGTFNDWNYPSICLYCLLDWVQFRELGSITQYPHLHTFLSEHSKQDGVYDTDPRINN